MEGAGSPDHRRWPNDFFVAWGVVLPCRGPRGDPPIFSVSHRLESQMRKTRSSFGAPHLFRAIRTSGSEGEGRESNQPFLALSKTQDHEGF